MLILGRCEDGGGGGGDDDDAGAAAADDDDDDMMTTMLFSLTHSRAIEPRASAFNAQVPPISSHRTLNPFKS